MLPLVPGPERRPLVPAARLPAALDQGAVDQLLQPGGGRVPCLQQVRLCHVLKFHNHGEGPLTLSHYAKRVSTHLNCDGGFNEAKA